MAQTIRANGIDMTYELTGPDGAPPVVLSHSLSATHRMWDAQMPALADYRVLRYDTRGHGGSTPSEGAYSLAMLADDAHALIRALGLGRVHFVGLSMGGMIGQTLALAHPESLRSLVLCDTSSGYPAAGAGMWAERIATAERTGLGSPVEGTIDRWFSPAFVEKEPAQIDPVREMIRSTPAKGYIGCCHAISKLDLTGRLGEIRVPTLVIVGEDDPGTPVDMARIIHDGIAGSELVVLPGARHLANIEAAEPFNAALSRFLARH